MPRPPRLTALLLAGALLAFPGLPALAQSNGPSIRITHYGEYDAARTIGTMEGAPHQQTLSEVQLTTEPRFEHQTDTITGHLCARFGLQYVVNGAPSPRAMLTVRVTHPLIRRPDGKSATVDQFETPMGGPDIKYTGFEFDEPWELTGGTWTFDLLYDGKLLATHSFDVVVPKGARALAGCAQDVS